MKRLEAKTVGITNRTSGTGGPATVQKYIVAGLKENGWTVVQPKDNIFPDIIFLNIGSTRNLRWILKCKRQGSKVLYRSANLFWRHQVTWMGLKKHVKKSWLNTIIKYTRNYLADIVVYQSHYAKNFFEEKLGIPKNEKNIIINNGTNLDSFKPDPSKQKEDPNTFRIITVEGNMHKENYVVQLLEKAAVSKVGNKKISINTYGGATQELKDHFSSFENITMHGKVSKQVLSEALKNADMFLSLEINAACPNSILEALSSGLPVVCLDTGASKELIRDKGGIAIPYGADVFKLEAPQLGNKLEEAFNTINNDLQNYKTNARQLAEDEYDSKKMGEKYIQLIDQLVEK